MPRGDKSSYASKQKHQAEHIEEGYEQQASRRRKQSGAWATVNKDLLDRDPGVAEAFLLHQREQDRGIGRMQPDAAL
jgi:hypothetical protein